MRRVLNIFFCFCFISEVVAQNTISVYDHNSNEKLANAHITFRSLSEGNVFKTISDEKGNVQLPIAFKTPIEVGVSYLGYQYYLDTLYIFQNKTVRLQLDARYLKEAVISDQMQRKDQSSGVNNVKVISSEMIEKMAAVTVKDVLANQLNFRISQDNATGSSNLSLQGISGQNVKILIDGVPVIGKIFDQVDLSQLNLNNIERIEIIQGPMSVSYGTNALAGTINIITKKQTGKKKQLGITSYNETNNSYNLYGYYNWSGSKLSGQLNAGRNFFGGWSATNTDRTWDWNLKELYFTRAQLFYKIKNWELNYRLDYNHEKIKSRGKPNIYGEKAIDEYFYTRRLDQAFQLNGKFKNNIGSQTIIGVNTYNRRREKQIKDLVNLTETPSQNNSDYDTNAFQSFLVRSTLQKSYKKWAWQTGIDLSEEWGQGNRIKNKNQQMGDYAFFGSAQWLPLKSTEIRLGLRGGYHTVYQMPIIPSIQASKTIANRYNVRMGWSKGFRAPSLKELYLDFVDANHSVLGNQNLKSENSNNFQMSIDRKWQKQNSVFKVELNVFKNIINNKIDLFILSSTSGIYQNIGCVNSNGFNATFQWNTPIIKQQLSLAQTGWQMDFNGFKTDGYLWSPELQYNASYLFKKPEINCNLFLKYNGKISRYAIESSENEVQLQRINPYTLVDLIVSKKIKNGFLLSLGGKNIFNITNVASTVSAGAHSSANGLSIGTGRTFFVKLDYTWNKK